MQLRASLPSIRTGLDGEQLSLASIVQVDGSEGDSVCDGFTGGVDGFAGVGEVECVADDFCWCFRGEVCSLFRG